MADLARKHPELAAELQTLVEGGLTPDELIAHFRRKDELKAAKELDNLQGLAAREEQFPDEIKLISRALAYRTPGKTDLAAIHELLNAAYMDEVKGPEAFRVADSKGCSVSLETIANLFVDASYQWLIAETTSSGDGVMEGGTMIGACCFSTDGLSRRNGKVEGTLGSIRLFGVLPNVRGLCLGGRILSKVEDLMFRKAKCCRIMVCAPSARQSMVDWIQRRRYQRVGACPYPAATIGQTLLSASESDATDTIELVQFIKARPVEDTGAADGKDKQVLSLVGNSLHRADTTTVTVNGSMNESEIDTAMAGKDATSERNRNNITNKNFGAVPASATATATANTTTATNTTATDCSDEAGRKEPRILERRAESDTSYSSHLQSLSQSNLPPLWRSELPKIPNQNGQNPGPVATVEYNSARTPHAAVETGVDDVTAAMRNMHPKHAASVPSAESDGNEIKTPNLPPPPNYKVGQRKVVIMQVSEVFTAGGVEDEEVPGVD